MMTDARLRAPENCIDSVHDSTSQTPIHLVFFTQFVSHFDKSKQLSSKDWNDNDKWRLPSEAEGFWRYYSTNNSNCSLH